MVLHDELSRLWPVGVVLVLIGTFGGALGDVLVKKAFERHKARVAAANVGGTALRPLAAGSVTLTPANHTPPQTGLSSGSGDGRGSGASETYLQGEPDQQGQAADECEAKRAEGPATPHPGAGDVKFLVSDWVWVCGMICTAIVDPLLTTLALMFAPSSIVTPFGGAHILWGCVLAVVVLRERMHYLDCLGAGLVIGGIVVIVVYASKSGHVRSVDDFFKGLANPGAAICLVVLLALLALAITLSCMSGRKKQGQGVVRAPSTAGVYLCSVDVRRLGVCGAAGLCGGFTNTVTKVLTLELSRVFEDPSILLSDWRPYFSVVLVLCFALPQLYFLNKSLRLYDAVFVVPTVNAVIILSGSVAAFCILREIPDFLPACLVGIVTVIVGIAFLSRPAGGAFKCCVDDAPRATEL